MITVTVFSTKDSNRQTVTVAPGAPWSELKAKINADTNISTSNMKAMVRSTRVSLERADAVIPDTDFTLILTPGKVKSGS